MKQKTYNIVLLVFSVSAFVLSAIAVLRPQFLPETTSITTKTIYPIVDTEKFTSLVIAYHRCGHGVKGQTAGERQKCQSLDFPRSLFMSDNYYKTASHSWLEVTPGSAVREGSHVMFVLHVTNNSDVNKIIDPEIFRHGGAVSVAEQYLAPGRTTDVFLYWDINRQPSTS